jgi:hypothetical protein
MSEAPFHPFIIAPSVPDNQVPSTKVETNSGARQEERRVGRYLKGPLSLHWIRRNIRDSADRLLLTLRAYSDMNNSKELKVSAALQRDAGIGDRKLLYRALNSLEVRGSITVRRKQGARAVVTLCVNGGIP